MSLEKLAKSPKVVANASYLFFNNTEDTNKTTKSQTNRGGKKKCSRLTKQIKRINKIMYIYLNAKRHE